MIKPLLFTLCFVFYCGFVFAADAKPRIDLIDKSETIKLSAVKTPTDWKSNNAVWLKDETKCNAVLVFSGDKIASEQWEDVEFSFIADKDGSVSLCLRGAYSDDKNEGNGAPAWVCYDDVVVVGAELHNGDFEISDSEADGPTGWHLKMGQYVLGENNKYVKARHAMPVSQNINVKAGQEVIINMKIKQFKE